MEVVVITMEPFESLLKTRVTQNSAHKESTAQTVLMEPGGEKAASVGKR